MRERLRAVPAWGWLVALVVISTAVRYAFARRNVAPWIMIDEIVYSELAKSFGAGDGFRIRDVPTGGYGWIYPVLISPAYALFDALPTAYAAVKAINSLAFSLAAVPAYLLARRVVPWRAALAVAALTVAVPSAFYAGVVMTENAFYAIFLLAALALVAALERPSPLRVVVFLAATGLAYATRAQAVALVPAALTAPLLVDARRIARFRWLYGLVLGLGALAVLVELARGRPLRSLVGAYGAAADTGYDPYEVAVWTLWHLGELTFYVGVIPVVALAILVRLLDRLELDERALVGGAAALVAWFSVEVAAFATQPSVLRIEERNLFYVAPLLFAALALWITRGLPRPRATTAVAAAGAVALAASLPYERFIGVQSTADALMTLPLWSLSNWFAIPLESMRWVVAAVAAALALAAALVPRRAAIALPALVLLLYVAAVQPVAARTEKAAIGALFQGITQPDRDWIDAAVGRDADVSVLWSGRIDRLVVNENEFFNRSVRAVYYLREPVPGNLAQAAAGVDRRTGYLLDPDGRRIRARFLLADRSLPLRAPTVAEDVHKGLVLTRVDGPLRAAYVTDGLYDDGWSRRTFSFRAFDCPPAPLTIRLGSDANLFRRAQVVRALVGGRRVATARVPPTREATLRVPLRRDRDGVCEARFVVARTAVPAHVQPDSTDTRRLGIRVLSIS